MGQLGECRSNFERDRMTHAVTAFNIAQQNFKLVAVTEHF
jgi:hypothetical protein